MPDSAISAVRTPNNTWPLNFAHDAWAYSIDAWQRSILILDALEQNAAAAPTVQTVRSSKHH
ncbi:hypothetical protein [Hyphomicrobium sp.]|uniref:hypothetical protein n=1 Tax=Hyphomicrobium sp. TaxID=82 RepID=UPI001D9575A3|nr:hypothetical protein [Hyphomicrobium sp.]MBY0561030.1 hypothetical protein [Hyphomicrobium sp.]